MSTPPPNPEPGRSVTPPPAPQESTVTVEALMSAPLLTIRPDAELWEARALMSARRVHHLMVEDRERLVGILSDRDIAYHASPYATRFVATRHDEQSLHRRVLQVASFEMVTIRHDATVEEATALILEENISALPVVSADGKIVGIVTTSDLLRALLACVLPSAH